MAGLPFLTVDDVAAVSTADAAQALREALLQGTPDHQPRTSVTTDAGQLLLMPARSATALGVKLVTVASNSQPRVQGVYVLFDAQTLAPVALLDGVALTDLRTAAVSALAADRLAAPDASSLVLFGTGPQAWGHVQALRAVRPLRRVQVVGRDRARTSAFVERVRRLGLAASAGATVEDADIVCLCTSATQPVLDGARVRNGSCVLAIGAHEPAAREVDTALVRRAWVVVEDRATALRESGDVLLPIAEGAIGPEHLRADLSELVHGAQPDPGRVTLFVSVGMAWEDLAVATLVHDRHHRG